MGTFLGCVGTPHIPEERQKEFRGRMLRLLREGGMMNTEEVNLFGKKISLLHFPEPENAMEAVKDAISAIRARRAEMNVPPSRKAQVIIVTAQPDNYRLGAHFITRMAYASELTVMTEAPADLTGMVTVATHDATVYMPMAELVDIAKELERIAAERKKAEENLHRIEAKLANESFTSRAPENVVNAEREKAEKARALIAKLDESAAAMKL